MGTTSSKPTNKVGGKVVKQKLDSASKTGVLSLREHKLENIPPQVFRYVRTVHTKLSLYEFHDVHHEYHFVRRMN